MILLDVRMPGIDGFETARLIRARERSKSTPIIFLTAAADEMTSMFRGYEVGAVDYLMKPVVPEVLKSKVAVFVELFRKSERLRESEDKLRRLAAHLISVREEERAHIAREIHDELGQVLTGLKMEVTWLAKRLKDKALIEKTDSMCELIDSSVQTVRKIATGLRPEMLDDMGLVAAVGWQAKEFQKRTGIRCRAKLPAEVKFDIDISTTMFRIFQEILTNVARHSRATRVDIELTLGAEHIGLDVSDNGVGIQDNELHARKSLGLLGMQERALLFGGDVRINGSPGHGTRVSVTIPLEQKAQMKVLIADDHPVVRQGLRQMLAVESDLTVVGEARNGQEVVELSRRVPWEVAVLDYNMPGKNGLELIKELRQRYPGRAVLVLSMYPEDRYAVRALKAGAAGYLTKESAPEELVSAIRKVAGGGRYVTPTLGEKLALELEDNRGKPLHETLSDREYQVMWMIASGKTVRQIADELFLSPNTVSTHRTRILRKMNMKSNAELMHYAIAHHLVD